MHIFVIVMMGLVALVILCDVTIQQLVAPAKLFTYTTPCIQAVASSGTVCGVYASFMSSLLVM